MPEPEFVADITDTSCDIAFIYSDLGADRDIPHVYWDNSQWVQVSYDAFREQWSSIHPALFAACEAVALYFNLDPASYDLEGISRSSPEKLRSLGNPASYPDIVFPQNVTHYSRWREIETRKEYMAERFVSGTWTLACLNREAFTWNIEASALSDDEMKQRYLLHHPKLILLGGVAPTADQN